MKITTNADKLISQLKKYRDGLSPKKQEFVKRLGDIGVNAAIFSLTGGIGDTPKDATFGIYFESLGNPVIGFVRGKTSNPEDLLFWEFGAGNYYNGMKSPNPKAGELGMGIGTYPGQTHVPNPGVWWYKGEDGKKHFSRGTKAAMPMYNASVEMYDKIEEVAREVFNV